MNAKVLIVDDSALMRTFHKKVLVKVGFITEFARNGQECLDLLDSFEPDVILLDINMPVMDGLTCLKEIMRVRPTPVVMVSSLTEEGAQETLDALALGAVDYIHKPNGRYSYNMETASKQMTDKILSAVSIKVKTGAKAKTEQTRSEVDRQEFVKQKSVTPEVVKREVVKQELVKPQVTVGSSNAWVANKEHDIIVVGVSTGGPNCLQTILTDLPNHFTTPIFIAQHMPKRFTTVFAERLNSKCKLAVLEVTHELKVQQGHIYIAQGDGDMIIKNVGNDLYVAPVASDKRYLWHPSVSKLVDSALSSVSPGKLCCVQLTGMGNDGVQEMLKAYSLGATTIAESSETAVVFGMPGELVKKNGATHIAPNHKIASLLM